VKLSLCQPEIASSTIKVSSDRCYAILFMNAVNILTQILLLAFNIS